MAKDAGRRKRDERGSSKQQRREVGTHGSSWGRNKKNDPAVRRQTRLATDGRLVRARQEREAAERALAALDAQLDGQTHIPYRPEPIEETQMTETPAPAKTPSRETKPAPISWTPAEARHLIKQGYHIERVVTMTGVPVEQLKSLVGSDGYARGL